jgi:nucleoside-diphosphate-sugar epimerase
MSKLIFGCGYLGSRVARLWRQAGHEVFVVTRSNDRARAFAAEGLRPIVADVLRPNTLVDLPAADTVLYAIGYDRGYVGIAGASMHEVYVDGLGAVLAALPAATNRFLYVSSTGVYGQSHGETVDENSPCEPTRAGGRACLAAEALLAADLMGNRGIVLRMAGLYGPGRIPNLAEIRNGRPLAVTSSGHLNLIHVDDAAAVVLAADERASPPRAYLVSDGQPVERHEYYSELARLLCVDSPEFVSPPADNPAAIRASADKLVNNERMVAELAVRLKYPSYREGLAAILAAET